MQTQPFSTLAEEKLSALADGELGDSECAELLSALRNNPAAAGQWNTYQLIGDALRSGQSSAAIEDGGADFGFVQRLGQRLAGEKMENAGVRNVGLENVGLENVGLIFAPPSTALVASSDAPSSAAAEAVGTVNPLLFKNAANDGTFRWKMLAGFACMGTVASLAWSLVSPGSIDGAAQLAQSAVGGVQQQVVVASPQGLVVRDARLEELLAAHRQMGGTSLPVPSGFVRNANFENQPKNPR